jgi:hypothetical protein
LLVAWKKLLAAPPTKGNANKIIEQIHGISWLWLAIQYLNSFCTELMGQKQRIQPGW